jgi:hypothetical protein
MMPQVVRIRFSGGRSRRRVRLWIPLVPLFLVLAPLELLALLVVVVACLVGRINPLRALGTCWRLFVALNGTRIDVEQGGTAVLVSIA